MIAQGNLNLSVFKTDTKCLTNFLALVREHFEVFQDGSAMNEANDFGAKDLLNVIRTGGQTKSRVAF